MYYTCDYKFRGIRQTVDAKKLKKNLEGIESARFGNVFESLKTNGFRGGKHLIEILKKGIGNDFEFF